LHPQGPHDRVSQEGLRGQAALMLGTVAHRPAMTRIVIQWQDQFGRWQRY